jgi:hypothetical protein
LTPTPGTAYDRWHNRSFTMKYSSRLALFLVCSLFQAFTLLHAIDSKGQPHMRNAIGHLEAAKTAKDPLISLKAARKSLVNAKKNKEGERVDALGYVDEAIAYATTGNKKTMVEKIDKAIGNVKSGIARAR